MTQPNQSKTSYAKAGKKLFTVNGTDEVQLYDGTKINMNPELLTDIDRKIDEREKIADILRTGHHGIAETKVVNALLALINEARADNIKSLVTDMQMDMRLKFDAKHDDFQTFDGMCAFMNLWVAERIAELKGDK